MADSYSLASFDDVSGLFAITENGQNVLNSDAVRFGLGRNIKRDLIRILKDFVRAIKSETDTKAVFYEFQKRGVLKRLVKQESVQDINIWEIKETSHGGRVFFVFAEPNVIIVSAVDKVRFNQDQAVNRGAKRWKILLKNLEKGV